MGQMEDNKREESVKESASSSSTNRMMGLIGLMVILLLFVGAIVLLGRGNPNEQLETDVSVGATESEAPSESGEDEAVATSGRFLGSPDAPLLIKDFSDFRCPHCRDAAYNLTPKIIDEYVKKGLVRLEFIPVVVTSEEGLYGGMAALCAEEQGQFWAYHDILFERQGEEEFNPDNLERFAEELSMDTQEFHDCMLSGKFGEQLLANNEQFQQSGATGTPTFIIGDELTAGGLPFEEIQKIIEAQLNQ